MGRTALPCLLAVCLPTAAPAQERSPAFVTVVDAAGKPIAGAEVTCTFTPDAANPWPRDVVLATTDNRGRALCNLVPRRLYNGWAVGPADERGARLVSDPVPLIAAGRLVELRAIDLRPLRAVRVQGHVAWHDVGAKALRWFPDASEDAYRDLPWPVADTVELPASPVLVGCLGLIDAQGELLVTTKVDVDADALPEFAPPMELQAEVVDADDWPFGGAAIEYALPHYTGRWSLLRVRATTAFTPRHVGATDGDGTLRFFAPLRNTPLPVTASRRGYALDTRRVASEGSVPFTLLEEVNASIRIVGAADRRAEAGASTGARSERTRGGALVSEQRLLRVDGDAASWIVRGANGEVLPRVQLCTATPGVVLHDWIASRGREFTFDLRNMRRIEVTTQDASGSPLACAIAVGRVGDAQPLQWCAACATDPAGRATLYVPGNDWFVYATTTAAHAMAIVPETGASPLVLQLEPVPTMRVRVVDAAGAAIAGARVSGQGVSYRGLQGGDLTQQWQKVLAEVWWSYVPLARSDADGFLRIPEFTQRGLETQVTVAAGSRRRALLAVADDGTSVVTLKD